MRKQKLLIPTMLALMCGFAAAASELAGGNARAANQAGQTLPTISAPELTLTRADIGKVIELPLTLTMPEGHDFTNIQFDLIFPKGLRPIADEDGLYGYGGNDIPTSGRRPPVPVVMFTDNLDDPENWPNYRILGANMTKTPVTVTPCHVYTLNVTADADFEPGERNFKVYVKYTNYNDESYEIGSYDACVTLTKVKFVDSDTPPGGIITDGTFYYNIVSQGSVNEVEFAPKHDGTAYTISSTSAFSNIDVVSNNGIDYTIVGVGEHAFENAQFPTNGNTNFPRHIRYVSDYAFKGVKSGSSESRGSIRFYGDELRYVSSKAFLDNELQGSVLITSGDAENGFSQVSSDAVSSTASGSMYLAAERGTKYVMFPKSYPLGTSSGWIPAYQVTINSAIKTIGAYAMMNCTNYTQVNLGNVEVIDTAAFKNTALTTLTLPASITHIAADAFEGNTTLTSITVQCGYDAVKDVVFDDAVYTRVRESGGINVPEEELATYKSDPNWKKFWPDPVAAPKMYIAGTFTNWAEGKLEMTENNGTYTITVNGISDGAEFKFIEDEVWYGGDADGSTYDIHSEWCTNIPLSNPGVNFKIVGGGDLTFTIDANKNLSVTGWATTDLSAPTISAPELTLTRADIGKVIELPLTLTMPEGGDFTNIQFNLTFPKGLRPIADADGLYGYGGDDIPMKNGSPVVRFTDNLDREDWWPFHDVIGTNFTKTPVTANPCHIYTLNVTADADFEPGERDFKVYMKYTCSNNESYEIGSPDSRVTFTKVKFVDENPEFHELAGTVELVNPEDATVVYNGKEHRPAVRVVDNTFGVLSEATDYYLNYSNNVKPGIATITATGKGQFTGTLTTTFTINKAPIPDNVAIVQVEDTDILYDGKAHPATLRTNAITGMGTATVTYVKDGVAQTTAPVEPGEYVVNVAIAEGEYYLSQSLENAATFTIYALNTDDWACMVALYNATNGANWKKTIDVSDVKQARQLKDKGLATISKGRITELNLKDNGLSGELPASGVTLAALTSLNMADNSLRGNIGTFVAPMNSLTTLDVSGNNLSAIYPPLPATITSLNLFPQTVEEPVPNIDLSEISTDNLLGLLTMLPSIYRYNTQSQAFDCNVILDFHSMSDTYLASVAVYDNELIPAYRDGYTTEYRGQSGDKIKIKVYKTTRNGDDSFSNDELRGNCFTTLSFAPGDADFSGAVNVNDLQAIINKIFGNYPYRFNWTAANVIADDRLNVQDVVGEVNLLLAADNTGASAPRRSARVVPATGSPGAHRAPAIAEDEAQPAAHLYWRDGVLYLSSNTAVSAFDILLDGAATWLPNGMTLSGNGPHAVAYSLTGVTLPAGVTAIANATGAAPAVRYAALSDADAQPIALTIGAPNRTGVDDLAQKAISITANDGAIYLTAEEQLDNVQWAVVTIDGRLVAADQASTLKPGRNAIARGLAPGVYVVSVKYHGNANTQRKVIVR
ncbi:MAG: leucine-rich repeat protein [Muribaculaceae bacterium]|nr:leucine-rich repeat protein [Muribaculaceae bacterium]